MMQDRDAVLARLAERLAPDAQSAGAATFSDYDLVGGRPEGRPLKEAAVLVALMDRPEGLSVLFTRRTADMPTHAGQISFPGGRRQSEDASPVDTALREAREETGLDPALARVLGASDAYETVTAYRVQPIVALVQPPPAFSPDPREVADVFEAPLSFLMDPSNHVREERMWNGMKRSYYAIPFEDHYIWGATAGMLRALWLRAFA
jgi:8-oxo-dGTP pyrophosphatase MutT (NUDIX family)